MSEPVTATAAVSAFGGPGWWSVIPPLLAILLAILSRQVILSLGAGIWMGYSLLAGGDPLRGLAGAVEGLVAVFGDPGDTRVLLFTLVIGGLIATIDGLGGVRGFVEGLKSRRWVRGPRGAQWLAYGTGIVIFLESNITLLVAGTVARPLFDRYRLAREKLAYIIDSTSAPVCILIPLNAWGAVVIGLLEGAGVAEALAVFALAVPMNLYALAVIACCALVIQRGLWHPMREAQRRAETEGAVPPTGSAAGVALASPTPPQGGSDSPALVRDNRSPLEGEQAKRGRQPEVERWGVPGPDKARFMLLPIAVMVAAMPVGLYITGGGLNAGAGSIQQVFRVVAAGSGSTAVLWAVLLALLAAWGLGLWHRRMGVDRLMQTFMKGAGNMLPISAILLFALALGDAANALGTGDYVAGVAQGALSPVLMPPLLFLVSAFIAFSIGSSWGTFAVMIPLAMPIALGLSATMATGGDAHLSLFLAAVLSGAIFGDHASPISDTTVVASMASATDHIDHVRTQLPYALLCAATATIGFAMLGLVMM